MAAKCDKGKMNKGMKMGKGMDKEHAGMHPEEKGKKGAPPFFKKGKK